MLVVIKLLLVVILPVTLALISFRRRRTGGAADWRYLLDRLLFWYLVILVGGYGVLLGISQTLNGEWTARLNGWQYSPFVVELGYANLAFGILGLLCIRIKSPSGSTWDSPLTTTCTTFSSKTMPPPVIHRRA